MGVWIETQLIAYGDALIDVTPCMGVWIETPTPSGRPASVERHTLYGCVD